MNQSANFYNKKAKESYSLRLYNKSSVLDTSQARRRLRRQRLLSNLMWLVFTYSKKSPSSCQTEEKNIVLGGTIQNQVRQLLSKEVQQTDVNFSFSTHILNYVCVKIASKTLAKFPDHHHAIKLSNLFGLQICLH